MFNLIAEKFHWIQTKHNFSNEIFLFLREEVQRKRKMKKGEQYVMSLISTRFCIGISWNVAITLYSITTFQVMMEPVTTKMLNHLLLNLWRLIRKGRKWAEASNGPFKVIPLICCVLFAYLFNFIPEEKDDEAIPTDTEQQSGQAVEGLLNAFLCIAIFKLYVAI